MNSLIKRILAPLIRKVEQRLGDIKMLQAKQLLETLDFDRSAKLTDFEFKVFSQWGDDGIIQYLVNRIEISNHRFIEFGVENYLESNTRFLLMNNYWEGLVMDGGSSNINFIRNDIVSYKYGLRSRQAFVTAENINTLLSEEGFSGNIGLYHIDIDGNDFWVWKATTIINPDIVIVEYNSHFGDTRSISIPYKADFQRTAAHFSNLYWGASLQAFCDLADEKGYHFVGCNLGGNNAYFVKKEKSSNLRPLSCKAGFEMAKFNESRLQNGKLAFMDLGKRYAILEGLPVVNTRTGITEKI